MTERTKTQVHTLIVLASGVLVLLGIVAILVDMPIWAWIIVLAGECVACIPLYSKLVDADFSVEWKSTKSKPKPKRLPPLDINVIYRKAKENGK